MNRIESFQYSFAAAGATDIGRVRKSNQDELLLCPDFGFFSVIDGMGGLSGGGQAARTLKCELQRQLPQWAEAVTGKNSASMPALPILKAGVEGCSDHIDCSLNAGGTRFGATVCGVWLLGSSALFFSLGDCRGYLLKKDSRALCQITKDHTFGASLVESGALPRGIAHTMRDHDKLTRFAGMPAPAVVDCFCEEIQPGDHILLCSDGLYRNTNEVTLCRAIRKSEGPNAAVQELIQLAKDAGGRDNISAIVIQVQPEGGEAHEPAR